MTALESITQYLAGDSAVLRTEPWLQYLALTHERNVNLERVDVLAHVKSDAVLQYVRRTLETLSNLTVSEDVFQCVESTLKWSEVAKCGQPHRRKQWLQSGFNLFVHNEGSAQIYRSAHPEDVQEHRVVEQLIRTHGMFGQVVRGEVHPSELVALYGLIKSGDVSEDFLFRALTALNQCVISGVSKELWLAVQEPVLELVMQVVGGNVETIESDWTTRLRKLRTRSIHHGEDFDEQFFELPDQDRVHETLGPLFQRSQLWYVEAALHDFSLEECVKILLLVNRGHDSCRHISFEPLMRDLHYDHAGQKRVNLYKKRVIEKYLRAVSIHALMQEDLPDDPHVKPHVVVEHDTALFTFQFSPPAQKLMEFCVEAEKSGVLYERAILLLYDLFGFRRDPYDRFYNEEEYLKTMNQSVDYKRAMLDYVVGDTVLDVGPGGGVLLDLLEATYPEKRAVGIDISQNVIQALQRKKRLEGHVWDVVYGDALDLARFIPAGSVHTILFSSILHELFSYVECEGRRFQYETLRRALRSAWGVLAPGGRIVIRDGIMSEPKDAVRIIRFRSDEGMNYLKRYGADFAGFPVQYEVVGQNEVAMPINTAMEMLYTYTWGEEAYPHEVQEQFGYFTPSEYKTFIEEALGGTAQILKLDHFLQEGYTLALSQKIEFFDEKRNPVRLPDSTCFIVIQKGNDA